MPSAQAHPAPETARGINVAVSPGLHRQLKVQAAYRGLTLQAMVERAIKAGLANPNSLDDSQKIGMNGAGAPVENEE